MSKRPTRHCKDKVRSVSPTGSESDSLECIDVPPQSSATNTETQPVPASKTKRMNYHGKPTSCINDPLVKVEGITTQSISGVEDPPLNPIDIPVQKKLCVHKQKLDQKEVRYTKFYQGLSSITWHEDEISDDWDENEMQLAMSKSRKINNKLLEGSSGNIVDDDDNDDPFIDVISKNVMPIPPSKPKKVYLEDFENFTVKALPEKDESFFLNGWLYPFLEYDILRCPSCSIFTLAKNHSYDGHWVTI
ncbi:hypothetical protein BYT27DRAFT_7216930 [Phlegmacium glaucopus]|nr:hypothetical protein BYT27DRAFT_7216930 [Phlegmacium glaucopus]